MGNTTDRCFQYCYGTVPSHPVSPVCPSTDVGFLFVSARTHDATFRLEQYWTCLLQPTLGKRHVQTSTKITQNRNITIGMKRSLEYLLKPQRWRIGFKYECFDCLQSPHTNPTCGRGDLYRLLLPSFAYIDISRTLYCRNRSGTIFKWRIEQGTNMWI